MTLAEGSKLPAFNAKDTDGNEVSDKSLAGKPAVIYFMAGAGMGCTTQSCAFRDAAADFNKLDASIIGISARNDGAAFKSTNSLEYPIVNDGSGELQRTFGVPKTLGIIPGRVTYVVDKESTVQKVFNAQFSFADHVRIAKETIEGMK